MNLYQEFKPAVDRLFNESISSLMDESEFYPKMEVKFKDLEEETRDLNPVRAQKKLSKSEINRILKVHSRILLIRDLRAKVENAENNLQTYMYPGLITYLYLTCFDQLGQPQKGWYFFLSWIKSNSKVEEVNRVIDESRNKFKGNSLDEIKYFVENVYSQYHEKYGVRHSFFRFLQEVISDEKREKLHNSILVEKFTHNDEIIEDFKVDNIYKEKWLFQTRNNYTHNLFTTETNINHGKYRGDETWLIREKVLKKDGIIVIWVVEEFNSVIEEIIVHGIERLIRN